MTTPAPLPHNPRRMGWDEVPGHVRERIADAAGSDPLGSTGAKLGFSPGFAGIVDFANGDQLFLKVMSASRDPWSIEINRREAWVMSQLPENVPAPRLAWTFDDGEWSVIATEVVAGEPANPTEDQSHATAMWAAFERLAACLAPAGLPSFAEHHGDMLDEWRRLADANDRDDRIDALGEDGAWVRANLEHLISWEAEAASATQGDALVHSDIRADNALITHDNRAVIVDWPHAARGAPWLDLALYLPSHAMYGGGACAKAFRSHTLSTGVSADAERAFATAIAGYFTAESTLPEVPALPGLRAFQRAQALPALAWLKHLTR